VVPVSNIATFSGHKFQINVRGWDDLTRESFN